MNWLSRLGFLSLPIVLAACDLAPPYRRPTVDLPAKYKEGGSGIWHIAQPGDCLPRGAWWTAFDDQQLDELEPQVDDANQSLADAFANYQLARTTVQRAEAGLFPSLDSGGHLSTNRQSDNRPLRGADEPTHYGDNELEIQASYEVDLWGHVHDSIASSAAEAQAQAALLESVRLSLHAELAREYVALRGLDRQLQLLLNTTKAYQDALALTQQRFAGKIASPLDVARAQSQLDTARALYHDTLARRALLEHAISTLVGKPASLFTLPTRPVVLTMPRGPAAAPSTLLERRPDIAGAERGVAAANEQIGVARATFYPRVFINLSGGTQGTGLHLLDLNNEFFSLGPSVTLPLFDGGLRTADLKATLANRDHMVARYRASFLQAVQEVEDALAQERELRLEDQQLDAAAAAQQKALDLSLTLYRDGAADYLDVVTAQTTLLDQQRAALIVRTQQLTAAVDLFVALGGGWNGTLHVASRALPSHEHPVP